MLSIIWKVNGVDMPTPSSFKISMEDVDNNSYRSVVNASLIRDRIAKNLLKVSFSYNFITKEDATKIKRYVKEEEEFLAEVLTPFDEHYEFYAYCSKMEIELLECQIGYSISFNIIQTRV